METYGGLQVELFNKKALFKYAIESMDLNH